MLTDKMKELLVEHRTLVAFRRHLSEMIEAVEAKIAKEQSATEKAATGPETRRTG